MNEVKIKDIEHATNKTFEIKFSKLAFNFEEVNMERRIIRMFSPNDIIAGNGFITEVVVLIIIGILLYSIGIIKFLTKDLPL